MPKTSEELRAFTFGIVFGIVMFVVAFGVVSELAHLTFVPMRDGVPVTCPVRLGADSHGTN